MLFRTHISMDECWIKEMYTYLTYYIKYVITHVGILANENFYAFNEVFRMKPLVTMFRWLGCPLPASWISLSE